MADGGVATEEPECVLAHIHQAKQDRRHRDRNELRKGARASGPTLKRLNLMCGSRALTSIGMIMMAVGLRSTPHVTIALMAPDAPSAEEYG